MRRLFRAVLSVLVSLELLLGSILSAGRPADIPQLPEQEYGKYVNAFVGTGGIPWMCGMLSPAACAPFGSVRLCADTCAVGGANRLKTNTSGYYYAHRHILGFSCGRLSGTGARDYGMFRVTPFCSDQKPSFLAFSHQNETAMPGYYAVQLPGAACLCEMTATAHAGLQRYTFSTDKDAKLFFDAAAHLSGGSTRNTVLTVDVEKRTLTAQTTLFGVFSGRYKGLTVYGFAAWDADAKVLTQSDTGVCLDFGNRNGKPVTLRIGISFVRLENAEENLRAEIGSRSFDDVYTQTAAQWEARLSSIQIDAQETTKEIFYTALYHTMIMPTDFTDINGEYLGFDRRTHTADGYTYRTDMSLWDTCRNVHALYTLTASDIQHDSLESLLRMAEQGGVLPRWPMGGGYSGSMFGNPANIVFAESYLKGVPFDVQAAYQAMRYSSDGVHPDVADRDGAEEYSRYGYLPDDLGYDYSVSKTLEYAWEDAALAVMADAAGYADAAAYYTARSGNYQNLWDEQTQYFRPKNADGTWGAIHPYMTSFFDDIFGTHIFRAYCEGSARQWRWGTVQDADALVSLFGSKEKFVRELDRFMRDAAPRRGAVDPGSGFWIGNQHDIHTPYLFNHADRPDLTQKWVRRTLQSRFSTDPDGLDGNDDGGTLSAWYVFSAMGFYPIAGTDRYWVGSPCIDRAVLHLSNGKTLTVRAQNQSPQNVYVSSLTLNGKPIDRPFLTHGEIADGGELVFTMTKECTR